MNNDHSEEIARLTRENDAMKNDGGADDYFLSQVIESNEELITDHKRMQAQEMYADLED